ncbi:MAG TPA: endonuclease/exonuclease/phosphatase family protein [Saprospiraceae bacterium]|nr:endonuclease/exonuclease/phosphatase family protein [Saprospiraceae bacterium]HRG20449.1 endonuclease/exonuclease/phosphatase family protein [Saprospiraceae bacterium]HRG64858.1 endonuclease/exonuclease/phosphatase family protein [Saprospiraceae bacterium]
MVIMLLMVALIVAGPEVFFVRQMSAHLLHIMLGLFALGFLFLFTGFEKLMLMSFAACGVLCVFIKNESNGELIYPKDNFTEKIAVCHINLSNVYEREAMVEQLNNTDVDLISFQELTPEWASFLNVSLSKNYPHSYQAVRIDPFGKGFYSRYPIRVIDTLSPAYAFDLAVEVIKNTQNYYLVSTYLTPSLNGNGMTLARNQMKNISHFVVDHPRKTIVLGEFNMVYWSDEISRFREATHLRNSRKDVIPASLRVPFDHVFYSGDLQCLALKDMMLSRKERIGIFSAFQQNLEPSRNLPKNH